MAASEPKPEDTAVLRRLRLYYSDANIARDADTIPGADPPGVVAAYVKARRRARGFDPPVECSPLCHRARLSAS